MSNDKMRATFGEPWHHEFKPPVKKTWWRRLLAKLARLVRR